MNKKAEGVCVARKRSHCEMTVIRQEEPTCQILNMKSLEEYSQKESVQDRDGSVVPVSRLGEHFTRIL